MAKRLTERQLTLFTDCEELSDAAAWFVIEKGKESTQARGIYTLALSGGKSSRRLFELLAEGPDHTQMPWEKTHLFWGDERCVPPTDPESNFGNAEAVLLSKVALPSENIHPVPVDQIEPSQAALLYEKTLRDLFQPKPGEWPIFDLILLGLGEDGHTASLFPRSQALRETTRWVVATAGGRPNLPRVTFTIPLLNQARNILWVVVGAHKAAVLRDVLEGPPRTEDLPAQKISPVAGTSHWFIDKVAAQLLTIV